MTKDEATRHVLYAARKVCVDRWVETFLIDVANNTTTCSNIEEEAMQMADALEKLREALQLFDEETVGCP